MRAKHGTFPVIIKQIEQATPRIKTFCLVDPSGDLLPPFSGGSHIVALIPSGPQIFRNPYSLISSPFDTRQYEIAVALDSEGRGGSKALHQVIKEGDRIEITYPSNQFALERLAKKHVLIAGGVGITPILGHLHELQFSNTLFELHYGVRSYEHAKLTERIAPKLSHSIRIYCEDTNGLIDFSVVFSDQPLGTHVYVCGPTPMLEAAIGSARANGWPDSHIHFERFDQQTTGDPFEVYLARSGRSIAVPPELSLLEAAEAAGINIPYLCRGGACGHCETDVLELDGEIIHRDIWLSDESKRGNTKFMPCVSRAKCRKLVLNA